MKEGRCSDKRGRERVEGNDEEEEEMKEGKGETGRKEGRGKNERKKGRRGIGAVRVGKLGREGKGGEVKEGVREGGR